MKTNQYTRGKWQWKYFSNKLVIVIFLLCTLFSLSITHSQGLIVDYQRSTFPGTYTTITGLSGPSGDDNALNVTLPFTFIYDDHTYDKVRICTNGWAELGSPTRPLSSSYSTTNGYLFSLDEPNKILAPWWDDLATGSGSIQYTTLGSSPNRAFVVEWKNILSYYTSSRTINFQLRLYETSGIIEFWYGGVSGTGSSSESASFGIEDATGGSGYFIDGPTGSTTLGTINLTTIANWPTLFYRFSHQHLQVLRPNGEEYFHIGYTDTIKWTAAGPTNVKLEYSTDAGSSWSVIIASTPASTGNYPWVVPTTPTTQGKVRISDVSDPSVFDMSDSVFIIQYAPSITVTPDSFTVSLNEGDSTSRTMTIGNTGLGELRWSVNITSGVGKTNITKRTEQERSNLVREIASHPDGNNAGVPTVSPYSWQEILMVGGTKKILSWVGYTDLSYGGEYENTLNAIRMHFSDFSIDSTSTTSPTVLENLLSDKNIFLVPEQENISDLTSLGTSFSTVLSNFVNHGGTIIVLDYSNMGATTLLNGTGLLSIDNVVTSDAFAVVHDPTSPLVKGLPTTFYALNGSNYHTSPDGQKIVRDSITGNNRVTVKKIGGGQVVYIGMDYYSYNSDMARLLANAVESSISDFLTVEPNSGVVSSGLSQDVTVNFNAGKLRGGDYRATIVIESNDPVNSPKQVPTHLHVIGAPNIVVSDDTLDFGDGFIGYHDTLMLRISNTGSDTLKISGMVIDNSYFTVDGSTIFSVSSDQYRDVGVIFSPTTTGIESGTLTISSNDSSDLTVVVQLSGNGIHPPVMTVVPDSFTVSLSEGDSTSRTMTIGNTGLGTLTWEISQITSAAVKSYSLPAATVTATFTDKQPRIKQSNIQSPEKRDVSALYALLSDLTGKRIGMTNMGYYYTIGSDLQARGATVSSIWFPLTESVLDTLDILAIDDAIGDANSSDITLLRSWVQSGKGLLIQGDDYITQYDSLLVGSGITMVSLGGFYDALLTNIISHPITAGVDTISAASYGSYCTITTPAQTIVFDDYSRPHAVVSSLGNGLIVTVANEVCVDYNLTYLGGGDTRLFSNQIFTWLAEVSTYLSVVPDHGIISPGSSQDVTVNFNAEKLRGGDYHANIVIESNDPVNSPKQVPTHLHVIGAPNIVVSDDTLDFGDGFIGYNDTLMLRISNTGSDTLKISGMVIDNSHFAIDGSTIFSVSPDQYQDVEVVFSPTTTGLEGGTLTISSNDSSDLTVVVQLRGNGIHPPVMTVVPDSFTVSLNEGDSTSRTMTIGNVGTGDLIFSITNSYSTSLITSKNFDTRTTFNVANTTQHVHRSFKDIGSNIDVTTNQPFALGSHKLLRSMTKAASGGKILWDITHGVHGSYTPSGDYSTLSSLLNGLGFTIDITSAGVNNLDLSQYSVVVINLGSAWLSAYTPAEVTALANYVLNGGGLVVMGENTDCPNDNINPVAQAFGTTCGVSYLSPLDLYFSHFEPHPLFTGISLLYYRAAAELTASAPSRIIAFDTTGRGVVTVAEIGLGKVVVTGDINFWDNSCIANAGNQLFAENTFNWLSAPAHNWLSEDPIDGTVAPSGAQDIAVKLNALHLSAGDYRANIVIANNDPRHNPKIVPVHLHVIGAPNIVVSDDTLDFGDGYIGYNDTLMLRISNTGSDTLKISGMLINNSSFTVDGSTIFSVSSDQYRDVGVIFSPTTTGIESGTLTISSNDSSDLTVVVQLSGNGIHPPVMTVVPDSFTVSLNEGDSTSRTMTIGNVGLGDLRWEITTPSTSIKTMESLKIQYLSKSSESDPSLPFMNTDFLNMPTNRFQNTRQNTSGVFFADGFEDGDYNGWTSLGTGTKEVTNATAANGTKYSFHEYNSPVGHDHGVVQYLGSCQPRYVSVYIRSGSTSKADAYFVPRSSSGSFPFWIYATSSGQIRVGGNYWSIDAGTYVAHVWYHAEFKNISWSDSTFDFYLDGNLIQSGLSLEGSSDVASIYLYNYQTGSEGWWDEIYIGDANMDWWNVTPTSGTISSGSTQEVTVKFNAKDLRGGDYNATIVIESNDPVNSPKQVPVHLHVIGVPNIVVSDDTLDFSDMFIGYNDTLMLRISNTGSDTLKISGMVIDNSHFTVAGSTVFSVSPDQYRDVGVVFSPTTTGIESGTLTISSNDSSDLTVLVQLLGNGIHPPIITLSIDSLPTMHLPSGDTATYILGVTNQGGSELSFNALFTLSSMEKTWRESGIYTGKALAGRAEELVRLHQEAKNDKQETSTVSTRMHSLDSIFLPVHLTDALGYLWDIQGNGNILNGTSDAFDGGFRLNGFGYFTSAQTEEGGREIVIGPSTFGAISMTRKIYVPTDAAFARFMEVLSNPTGSPVSIEVNISTNLGSDSYELFGMTSSGDSVFTTADNWIVTDDIPNANDPAVVHVIAGTEGAIRPTSVSGGKGFGNVSYLFNVTVPAYGEAIIMHFGAQRLNGTEGVLSAQSLELLSGEALSGITAAEKLCVKNFLINPIFSVEPQSGVLFPDSSINLQITYNAARLDSGFYTGNMLISSNDPARSLVTLPISLHVVSGPVGVKENEPIPDKFALQQNYPNPFNPLTKIRYELPVASQVRLKIYNLLGQEVKTLVDEVQPAGYAVIDWNSTNNSGASVACGVYFYRLEATNSADPKDSFVQVKKLLLVK